MTSVYVTGQALPVVLEFLDQDPSDVADFVENWCEGRQVLTFKHLPRRVVINFGMQPALIIATELDRSWSEDSVVPVELKVVR